MLLEIDRHSGVPAYRQIVDQVRFLVAGGVLRPGAELSSTRELASRLGLNPMTVSKAWSLLERDGVVERRPGQRLVVREQAAGEERAGRRRQLARHLQPLVTTVRQLGLEPEEALEVFGELLDGQGTAGVEDES